MVSNRFNARASSSMTKDKNITVSGQDYKLPKNTEEGGNRQYIKSFINDALRDDNACSTSMQGLYTLWNGNPTLGLQVGYMSCTNFINVAQPPKPSSCIK